MLSHYISTNSETTNSWHNTTFYTSYSLNIFRDEAPALATFSLLPVLTKVNLFKDVVFFLLVSVTATN